MKGDILLHLKEVTITVNYGIAFFAGMLQERTSSIQAQKPSDFVVLHGACTQHIETKYKIILIVSLIR